MQLLLIACAVAGALAQGGIDPNTGVTVPRTDDGPQFTIPAAGGSQGPQPPGALTDGLPTNFPQNPENPQLPTNFPQNPQLPTNFPQNPENPQISTNPQTPQNPGLPTAPDGLPTTPIVTGPFGPPGGPSLSLEDIAGGACTQLSLAQDEVCSIQPTPPCNAEEKPRRQPNNCCQTCTIDGQDAAQGAGFTADFGQGPAQLTGDPSEFSCDRFTEMNTAQRRSCASLQIPMCQPGKLPTVNPPSCCPSCSPHSLIDGGAGSGVEQPLPDNTGGFPSPDQTGGLPTPDQTGGIPTPDQTGFSPLQFERDQLLSNGRPQATQCSQESILKCNTVLNELPPCAASQEVTRGTDCCLICRPGETAQCSVEMLTACDESTATLPECTADVVGVFSPYNRVNCCPSCRVATAAAMNPGLADFSSPTDPFSSVVPSINFGETPLNLPLPPGQTTDAPQEALSYNEVIKALEMCTSEQHAACKSISHPCENAEDPRFYSNSCCASCVRAESTCTVDEVVRCIASSPRCLPGQTPATVHGECCKSCAEEVAVCTPECSADMICQATQTPNAVEGTGTCVPSQLVGSFAFGPQASFLPEDEQTPQSQHEELLSTLNPNLVPFGATGQVPGQLGASTQGVPPTGGVPQGPDVGQPTFLPGPNGPTDVPQGPGEGQPTFPPGPNGPTGPSGEGQPTFPPGPNGSNGPTGLPGAPTLPVDGGTGGPTAPAGPPGAPTEEENNELMGTAVREVVYRYCARPENVLLCLENYETLDNIDTTITEGPPAPGSTPPPQETSEATQATTYVSVPFVNVRIPISGGSTRRRRLLQGSSRTLAQGTNDNQGALKIVAAALQDSAATEGVVISELGKEGEKTKEDDEKKNAAAHTGPGVAFALMFVFVVGCALPAPF